MSITTVPVIMHPSSFGNIGTAQTLDAAEEFVVFVTRFKKSGTVKRIGFRTGAVSGTYTIKVSLESVAELVGQPCATTNATKTLYTANAESADITNLNANTVNYISINGSTGVSVTGGDLVSITIRLTATSGGSVVVRSPGLTLGGELATGYDGTSYCSTYLGSSWATISYTTMVLIVYSDGIYNSYPSQIPCNSNSLTYNSESASPYTGIKFRYPFKCRLSGIRANCDLDGDAQIIIYDSDEYTVMAGFPISLNNLQRATTSARWISVVFTTPVECEANTDYRIVVLPTTSTNIILTNWAPVDDSEFYGYTAFPEGDDIILTRRGSAPSSGDHVWTDSTDKPHIQVFIDGIEASAGAAGGISRSRQLMG